MSEDGSASPAPYVADASVLIELARGDAGIGTLIQELDAAARPLIVPVLAVTAASLDMRSEDAAGLLEGLELFGNVMIDPLQDAEQALDLAKVIARTGLSPWDAQTALIADAEVCPILTLDGAKWREHSHDLNEPLHFVEIADPGDGA